MSQHKGLRTGNACGDLLKVEPMLWRFMESPGLDLTNNSGEGALRQKPFTGLPPDYAFGIISKL